MRDTTSDREYDSRFDPAFQPGFDDSAGGSVAELFGAASREEVPQVHVGEAPRRLVDRFVVALWIIGAALTLGGSILLLNAMAGIFTTNSSSQLTFGYQMLMMLMQFSPYLVTVGLATLIGTLFLLAVRWERRS